MKQSLFELAQLVRESVSTVDAETGEIIDSYDDNCALFDNKAVACVAYMKDEAAQIDAAKAMLKEMAETLSKRTEKLERFKQYVQDCMKATGALEVSDEHGFFKAKLYIDRDESVHIDDSATFPPELCNDPKPPTPSKTKIKAALKAGQAIEGASLTKSDRLTIS
jgi:hypothetical protein